MIDEQLILAFNKCQQHFNESPTIEIKEEKPFLETGKSIFVDRLISECKNMKRPMILLSIGQFVQFQAQIGRKQTFEGDVVNDKDSNLSILTLVGDDLDTPIILAIYILFRAIHQNIYVIDVENLDNIKLFKHILS